MVAAIIGIIIAVVFTVTFVAFNRLAKARNTSDAAWQEVIAQFEKRREMIPAFIEFLNEANETDAQKYKEVLKMRRQGTTDCTVASIKEYESEVSHELTNLLRGIATYPEMKSSATFYDLVSKLTESENHIEFARTNYNETVRKYNEARLKFPMTLLANQLDFENESFFEVQYVTPRQPSEHQAH